MQTRQNALERLKDRNLTEHERERIHQYLHYLDAEGITPRASSNKPSNSRRGKPHAGKAK